MSRSYLLAKKFVSILGIHRNKDLLNYFPKDRSGLFYDYDMHPHASPSAHSNRCAWRWL